MAAGTALFQTEISGTGLPLATTVRESGRRFVVLYIALTTLEILVLAALGWTAWTRA